jgi:hypothetical protein
MKCEACGINRRKPYEAIPREKIGNMVLCAACANQAKHYRTHYIIANAASGKYGIDLPQEILQEIKEFMVENRVLWRKLSIPRIRDKKI